MYELVDIRKISGTVCLIHGCYGQLKNDTKNLKQTHTKDLFLNYLNETSETNENNEKCLAHKVFGAELIEFTKCRLCHGNILYLKYADHLVFY